MKRFLRILIPVLMLTTQALRAADNGECLQAAVDEMNDLYRTGCGCEDGIFNAVSSSMMGWGVGLFVGIALLTGLIHNSHQESKSSSNNSSN
jgi:hypothetical protein